MKKLKLSLMAGTLLPAALLAQERPNIIYIMTDQQTATAMSCAGNPDLKTPTMDRLAERGMRFTNAYCSLPLSGPSRASMFTGHTPAEIGTPTHCRTKMLSDLKICTDTMISGWPKQPSISCNANMKNLSYWLPRLTTRTIFANMPGNKILRLPPLTNRHWKIAPICLPTST